MQCQKCGSNNIGFTKSGTAYCNSCYYEWRLYEISSVLQAYDSTVVRIVVACPVCGKKHGVKSEGYPDDMLVFKNKEVECSCGMKFFPIVENRRAKSFLVDLNKQIQQCFKEDMKKGARGRGEPKGKRHKKRVKIDKFYGVEE